MAEPPSQPAAKVVDRPLELDRCTRPLIATCMYYTGIDPFTGQEVHIARQMRDRKLQRALMQFFTPENWFTVGEALIEGGKIRSARDAIAWSPTTRRRKASRRGGGGSTPRTTSRASPIRQ